MKKTKTIAKLKKDLDKVFNAFIRKRDEDHRCWGWFVCLSCGETKDRSYMHASHFYAATFLATRWDERNVNGCCVKCNVFLHGNLLEYRKGMIAKYGIEVVNELEDLHNKPVKLDRGWLEERIKHYKNA